MNSFRTHATLPTQAAIDATRETLFGIERHLKGIGTFKVNEITVTPIDHELADVTMEWVRVSCDGDDVIYGAGFMVIG